MSSTTILKTGGSTRKPTIDNSKKIDSKISTMNKVIETKVNKVGDKITGNIDMSNNRIMNVNNDPRGEGDAIGYKYFREFFRNAHDNLKREIHVKDERIKSETVQKAGDSMRGTLDMGNFGITGLNFPDSASDAINKKYLQISSLNNSDNISTKKLMSICRCVNDLLMNHSKDFSSAFDRAFRLKYTWMQNLILKYHNLYKKPDNNYPELQPIVETILFPHIKDLICLLFTIIEELSQNSFTELKKSIVGLPDKILITPGDGTNLIKIRRFINKFGNDLDPERTNKELELILQKNLMFVDLGFVYVSDMLLSKFVI